MDTIEQNKLIAEFMGWSPDRSMHTEDELQYHNSWNWLMPVVEKIHSLGWWPTLTFGGRNKSNSRTVLYNPNNKQLFDGEAASMLEATYKAVVQFIQWFNENKQP